VTDPLPLPVAPVLTVIHDALLLAVQAQPVGTVTVTVPVPAADVRVAEAGEIAGAHDIPVCVTVNVDPAIVSVPTRLVVLVLAAMLNVTVPAPDPDAPAPTVIHATLLTAVHWQPVPAVTVLLPEPPAAATDWDDGEMVGVHAPVNANVLDRVLAALPPDPMASTTAS
jgi:hypothetical protein